jgi:hypothetical protein
MFFIDKSLSYAFARDFLEENAPERRTHMRMKSILSRRAFTALAGAAVMATAVPMPSLRQT